MSDERTWAVLGAVCGIAVAGAWAWFNLGRKIDRALNEGIRFGAHR